MAIRHIFIVTYCHLLPLRSVLILSPKLEECAQKEAHSTYCLTMAQYCPQLGQLFAIAGRKIMRREKNFGRSTIAIRNMLSGCWKRGFAREKPYSQIYPSPFTFSLETPINTGVVRGEGLAQPFTHPSPTLHLITKFRRH